MSNVITIITEEFKVPIHSSTFAGIHLNSNQGDLDQSEYEQRIAKLIGKTVSHFESRVYAHMVYAYTVYYAIKQYLLSRNVDIDNCYERAIAKVEHEKTANRWKFIDVHNRSAIDEDGNPRVSKKDEAYRLFCTNPTMSRKDGIALLVKELGMTESGASTYFANAKKEYKSRK